MKRISAILVIGMLVASTAFALERNTITVEGRGKARITPRQGQIYMAIQSSDAGSALASSSANAAAVLQLKTKLESIPGIATRQIRLGTASTTPRYRYDDAGNASFEKWVTEQQVTVTVKAKGASNLLGLVYQAGTEHSAMVNGPSPVITPKMQENALQRAELSAISNAKLRAQKIAKRAGATLGSLLEIQAGGDSMPQPYRARAMAAEAVQAVPEFTISGQDVNLTRSVVFELLK